MGKPLEAPDQQITLARAAQIAGLSVATLKEQATRGRLRCVQPGNERLTTRRWLHEYLTTRDDRRGGKPAPLPEGYIPPD